jgi:CNT family concentrative nucleoside transporter
VLRTDTGRAVFDALAHVVTAILRGADAGADFVFGPLAGGHATVAWKAIAGIKILTTIIVVSTLSAIGYHYGLLQRVVVVMAWVMSRLLRLSGPESLSGAANVFFGQTEAPLLVRPYIEGMSRSELMALMTGGFATVAAGVMAVYVDMLGHGDPAAQVAVARHLMTASLMSAPAAFVLAKIMVPPGPADVGERIEAALTAPVQTRGLLDAATSGAAQGMKLAVNVLAMLIAFIALITILDLCLAQIGRIPILAGPLAAAGIEPLNLDGLLGLLFAPVAWLNGVHADDARPVAALLAKAMATNEMIAYGRLTELSDAGALAERSRLIAVYSLCGFANFSSIGIQIGGIGSIAPSRRADLLALGPRAMLAGAMACWMTGAIAGALL